MSDLLEERTSQLPLEILAKTWPADRVLLGMRVCRWLRDELPGAAEEVTLVARHRKTPFPAESIERSLLRCKGRVKLVCTESLCLPGRASTSGASQELRALTKGLSSALSSGLEDCLTNLDFSYCGLERADVLLPVIAKCTALETVNLACNSLLADGLAQVAEALAHSAKTMKTLDFSRNELMAPTERTMAQVSVACAKLEQLTTLKLNGLGFGAEGATGLAVGLRGCAALTHLDLSSNALGDAGTQLCAAFPLCTNLTDLQLSDNQFCGKLGGKMVSAGLGSWDPERDLAPQVRSALTRLNVSGNKLEKEAWVLCAGLRNCTRLSFLDMSKSMFRDNAMQNMCGMLPAASLTHLELSTNMLGIVDPKFVAAVLQELTCLRRLGLADNHLKDQGAVLLGRDVLPRLSVLSDLDLAGNSVGDEGAVCLASTLGECVELRSIVLTRNKLGTKGCAALRAALDAIEDRASLIALDIRFNAGPK